MKCNNGAIKIIENTLSEFSIFPCFLLLKLYLLESLVENGVKHHKPNLESLVLDLNSCIQSDITLCN